MEVNSVSFFVFLGVGSILYRYLKSDKIAVAGIAILNLIFYFSGVRQYVPVLLFVVAVSYFSAIHVENCKKNSQKPHMGILILILLSLLLFFKYYNFVASIINSIVVFTGLNISVPVHSLVWPLGISFFTFTAIGYVIDVYFNTIPANRDFIRHLAFIGFFSQGLKSRFLYRLYLHYNNND